MVPSIHSGVVTGPGGTVPSIERFREEEHRPTMGTSNIKRSSERFAGHFSAETVRDRGWKVCHQILLVPCSTEPWGFTTPVYNPYYLGVVIDLAV